MPFATLAATALAAVASTGGLGELPDAIVVGVGGQGGFVGTSLNLGASMTSLGDLDGDGITDLVTSSYNGPFSTPEVFVLRRGPAGPIVGTTWISVGGGGFNGTPDGDFGASVASLGDIDGNGVPDIVVAAPDFDGSDGYDGELWILRLKPNGTVLAWTEINGNGEGGFVGPPAAQSFASAVTGIGDLDGDGVGDLAMRAGGSALFPVVEIWVLFLNSDGSVKAQTLVESKPFDGDRYGDGLRGIGDLDGNGAEDLAVSAPHDSSTGLRRGALHILFLDVDGSLLSEVEIDDAAGPLVGLLEDDSRFGQDVEAMGDLNGDGVDDLAVSALESAASFKETIFLLHMTPAGPPSAVELVTIDGPFPLCDDLDVRTQLAGLGPFDSQLPAGLAWNLSGAQFLLLDRVPAFDPVGAEELLSSGDVGLDGDGFGDRLAPLGDFDGNGTEDFVAVAPWNSVAYPGAGALVLVLTNPDGSAAASHVLVPNDGGMPSARVREVTRIGDLDGDGIDELAYSSEDLGSWVHVLFLHPDGTVRESQEISDDYGGMQGLLGDAAGFGHTVCGPGDIDGDGVYDLIASEYFSTFWTLLLNPDGSVHAHAVVELLTTRHETFAALGDLDGDGTPDVLACDQDNDACQVLFLNPDGSVKDALGVSPGKNGFVGSGIGGGNFGAAATSLGDRDGDGFLDVAIGEPGACSDGGFWILGLASDGTVMTEQSFGPSDAAITAETLNGAFGRGLVDLGDGDGDGARTLAAGAPGDDSVWLLEMVTPAPSVLPLGCGVNPEGSLALTGGWPTLGSLVTFGIDNPLGTQAAGSIPLLALSFAPDGNFPCGTLVPGWGMAAGGAPGELLVGLARALPLVVGPAWAGPGQPAEVAVSVPNDACQVGSRVYAQGVLFDPFATGGVELGLTVGLQLRIGP